MSSLISQCMHPARVGSRSSCLLRTGSTGATGGGVAGGAGTTLFHSSAGRCYNDSRGSGSSSSSSSRGSNSTSRGGFSSRGGPSPNRYRDSKPYNVPEIVPDVLHRNRPGAAQTLLRHRTEGITPIYTSQRDRVSNPLPDPDDKRNAMGWNLQKRHTEGRAEREQVRGVLGRERERESGSDRNGNGEGAGRERSREATTFPPRASEWRSDFHAVLGGPQAPVWASDFPAVLGGGGGRGGASASRNPGLARVDVVRGDGGSGGGVGAGWGGGTRKKRSRGVAGVSGIKITTTETVGKKRAKANPFSRDPAPHVNKTDKVKERVTVRGVSGSEGRERERDAGSSGSKSTAVGSTVSSTVALGRVFTAADADAGVNAYDLAALDAAKEKARLERRRLASGAVDAEDGEGENEVDMDVRMDGEREEEVFEYDAENEDAREEFFYPPGVVSNVKGVKGPSNTSPGSTSDVDANVKGKSKSKDALAEDTGIATSFESPPLIPGFVTVLEEMFGRGARPTPVQGLSLGWVISWVAKQTQGGGNAPVRELEVVGEESAAKTVEEGVVQTTKDGEDRTQTQTQQWKALTPPGGWREFLLAAETGSGKSIAYLLPMLQSLKQSESTFTPYSPARGTGERRKEYSPRGVVLAPTHELARQLAGFAKDLCHSPDTRLKVVCASRANVASTVGKGSVAKGREGARRGDSARKMKMMDGVVFDSEGASAGVGGGGEGTGQGRRGEHGHGADVIVGTPMKLLEMVRGRGWDRITEQHQQQMDLQNQERLDQQDDIDDAQKLRRGRDKMPHFGTWRPKSEMGLENVEWVVVDEADVLFDPDFQETTRQFLADVSAARGYPVPFSPLLLPSSTPSATSAAPTPTLAPIKYPFNLLLTSATIPTSLNTYLTHAHPSLLRLASPQLHKLPKTLQVEYVAWSGGNKFADVLRRLRRVWAEDAASGFMGNGGGGQGQGVLSQVVIFCNRSSKAEELGEWLKDTSGNGGGVRGVVVVTGKGGRGRGNNKHLESFLRVRGRKASSAISSSTSDRSSSSKTADASSELNPKVLLTTSLLSRGLDFSPNVKHVFIIDAPRNMVDFLHRAGRAGRAGERGRVVVFGKMKGRGSRKGKEVRGRVAGLV